MHLIFYYFHFFAILSPVSEASREVAILTEKNPHAPVYGVKEFVCSSLRLLQTLTLIIEVYSYVIVWSKEPDNNIKINEYMIGYKSWVKIPIIMINCLLWATWG